MGFAWRSWYESIAWKARRVIPTFFKATFRPFEDYIRRSCHLLVIINWWAPIKEQQLQERVGWSQRLSQYRLEAVLKVRRTSINQCHLHQASPKTPSPVQILHHRQLMLRSNSKEISKLDLQSMTSLLILKSLNFIKISLRMQGLIICGLNTNEV